MKLNRPARNPHSETIIALIDVVFFLLVFFMLIGRMDATAPFDVRPATAVTGRDMPAGGITLAVSAQGALALDGEELSREALSSALSSRLTEDPELRLRINAHRAAELRNVLPLVAEGEALGFRDVVLVVTPETDG
ncbi:ExbD/TolR family protein [Leisingera caerulea]|uniref:Biopolymer transporter ExbD n=1 Tax=Leisingera caerulea TaxID=506591 RepID=A0A9Q9HP01_LEICA|nr:biopolymer transporter ExbD [Leisingera caerulea]UWQ56404.1 biopolymer transporter ExbD [Leisingera caerulea]UWQ86197.1 biopolymer transporter ExbD [Leisingera caerulea]